MSHYTRRDCQKKFLPSHITLAELYEEYKKTCNARNPVSRRIFETEFHKMNLSIKKPKVDTCATCDKLALQITTVTDKTDLQTQLDAHHKLAEIAYETKKRDKLLSSCDKTSKMITFDMQQCLPTHSLKNSVAFYKR